MDNFFKEKTTTENPFMKGIQQEPQTDLPQKQLKRLNITDMEVLNGNSYNSEAEFIQMKMNNLQQLINQRPQTIDPITLEKLKIEWEDLRLKLYKMKNKKADGSSIKLRENVFEKMGFLGKKLSNISVISKFYSPKIKKILGTFNDINKEVEDLLKKSTPLGEENMKYGLLVNKIYQASKLNCELTNEMK